MNNFSQSEQYNSENIDYFLEIYEEISDGYISLEEASSELQSCGFSENFIQAMQENYSSDNIEKQQFFGYLQEMPIKQIRKDYYDGHISEEYLYNYTDTLRKNILDKEKEHVLHDVFDILDSSKVSEEPDLHIFTPSDKNSLGSVQEFFPFLVEFSNEISRFGKELSYEYYQDECEGFTIKITYGADESDEYLIEYNDLELSQIFLNEITEKLLKKLPEDLEISPLITS